MSEAGHGKRGEKPPPRIDDSLVQRYEARRKIEALLRRNMGEHFREEAVAGLAQRTLALSPAAEAILLELYLGKDDELGHMALLVLSEMPPDGVLEHIDDLLDQHDLSQEDELRLMMAKTFVKDDPGTLLSELSLRGDPQEMLSRMTGEMWKKLDPEQAAIVWLDQYGALEAEEKIPLLNLFLATPCQSILAIARLEAKSDNSDIERLVAERLADFPFPEAVDILEQLGQSHNMGVRLAAEHSLGVLRSSLPDLASSRTAGPAMAEGDFHKAFVARDALSGQFSVVYSQKSANGTIRFCVALIDTWDQGLMDIWGNTGFSEQEFAGLLDSFGSGEMAEGKPLDYELNYEPAEKDFAVYLLREGERLARRRGYDLPAELRLWGDLYAAEPHADKAFGVVFGRTCFECDAPIRTQISAAEDEGILQFGDFALCGKCLKRKSRCSACGEKLDLGQAIALPDAEHKHVDLYCRACSEKG